MCVTAYSARLIDGEIRDYEAPSVPSLNPCSVTTTRTFVVVDSNEIRNGRLCSWKIIVKSNSMSAPDILALHVHVYNVVSMEYEYDSTRLLNFSHFV